MDYGIFVHALLKTPADFVLKVIGLKSNIVIMMIIVIITNDFIINSIRLCGQKWNFYSAQLAAVHGQDECGD